MPRGGSDAGLGNLLVGGWSWRGGRHVELQSALGYWLCQQGRLAATKHGREWRIDVSSVEDFKLRGANAA